MNLFILVYILFQDENNFIGLLWQVGSGMTKIIGSGSSSLNKSPTGVHKIVRQSSYTYLDQKIVVHAPTSASSAMQSLELSKLLFRILFKKLKTFF